MLDSARAPLVPGDPGAPLASLSAANEQTIRKAFDEVFGRAPALPHRHARTAAYVLAVGRAAEAASVRGTFPSGSY